MVEIFATEKAKITAEMRALALLIKSTQTEVNRLKQREDSTKSKLDEIRTNPANFQREDGMAAGDDYTAAQARRLTMEGQMASLRPTRTLLDRLQPLGGGAAARPRGVTPPARAGSGAPVGQR